MIIEESQIIDEKGWWKGDKIESSDQCTSRIKDLLKEFKEMFKANREALSGKTLVAIAHGTFLNNLACLFTNNVANAHLEFFIPENNSMTILDFADVK